MTTRLQPTAKFLTVNGLALRYLEWGRPDALPVVCVHGYTSSAEAFNALARRLQDRARIMAMDVRGHGESAWSADGAYQYSHQAGDLTALVDQLGIERFVLIGTSMGGVIAMVYASQYADRLRGLVLNDIGPDVEAGSGRITGLVRTRAAAPVANSGDAAVRDTNRLGHRQRRFVGSTGEAHGRSLAKGRAGQRPWRRTCADPRRAAGPRRARPPSRNRLKGVGKPTPSRPGGTGRGRSSRRGCASPNST